MCFAETPGCTDPGNEVYAEACSVILLATYDSQTAIAQRPAFESVVGAGPEKKGDYVEAMLAAANVAFAYEAGLRLTWHGLRGGAHGMSDDPTRLLVSTIHSVRAANKGLQPTAMEQHEPPGGWSGPPLRPALPPVHPPTATYNIP